MNNYEKPQVSDLFFTTFVAQYCEIMAMLESQNTSGSILPMVMQAYVVDADAEYYYLGTNPLEINSAIKRNSVKFIQIIEDLSVEQKLLNDMPDPKSDEDVQ